MCRQDSVWPPETSGGICRSDGGVIELIAQRDERRVGVVLNEEGVAGE